VGSGAAGITLAREFLNSKFSVALIESGGMEVEREAKFLNDGQTSGIYSCVSQLSPEFSRKSIWGHYQYLDRMDASARRHGFRKKKMGCRQWLSFFSKRTATFLRKGPPRYAK